MDIRRKHRSDCEHVNVIRTSRVLSPDRDRARTSPGVFWDMALLGLFLELSFSIFNILGGHFGVFDSQRHFPLTAVLYSLYLPWEPLSSLESTPVSI